MQRVVGIATFLAVLASTASAACTREKLTESINACESLVNISQIKCDNKECHKALHVLVEADYIECYVQLGLGMATDLTKYKLLDDFCHGEGPDPTELLSGASKSTSAPSNSSGSLNKTTAPVVETPAPKTAPISVSTPTPSPSGAANAISVVSTVSVVAAAASLYAAL